MQTWFQFFDVRGGSFLVSSEKRLTRYSGTLSKHVSGFTPHPHETRKDFVMRRGRKSAEHAKYMGLWSIHVAKRICTWRAHILRNHVGSSWASHAFAHMDEHWYSARRTTNSTRAKIENRTGTTTGGRLFTRTGAGRPKTRFHDGAKVANDWVKKFFPYFNTDR